MLDLGQVFIQKGDRNGAIDCYRKAIAIEPDNVTAHLWLGMDLAANGDFDGAIANYNEAIRLNSTFAWAHSYLGDALRAKGCLDEAVASYKEAIRLDGTNAGFTASLARAARWKALTPRIADVAAGRKKPDSPREALEFAEICRQPDQKRYVAAMRLVAEALVTEPTLVENLADSQRYAAAQSAISGVTGTDADMTVFGIEEWGQLTDLAHQLLRADLAIWTERAEDKQTWADAVRGRLSIWLSDPHFDPVRDPAWLASMPEPDRKRWQLFWSEVQELFESVFPSPTVN